MEIPEILHHLESSSDEFPRTAVGDAIAQQDQITPELLRILEDVATNPSDYADRQDYFGHIYAMYLLAKFRETRAYPIIIRIVSVPGETIFDLLGDIVTQNLGSILASVSGNDVSGMQALIEDEQANDFVRDAAMRGLVTLVATGQRSRDEIMDYFAGLFRRLDRKWNFVWTGLTDYCTDLYPAEVQDEIRQAYEDGLIDARAIHPKDVEEALSAGEDEALKRLQRRRYRLIDDVEQEMSWFSSVDHSAREPGVPRRTVPNSRPFESPTTYKRSGAKVGRNDPCPCGSGKKFKKCCGK